MINTARHILFHLSAGDQFCLLRATRKTKRQKLTFVTLVHVVENDLKK